MQVALATHKTTGIPFVEDVLITADLPHSVSFAIMYASKLNSFNELTEDKQPPRGIYDKPFKLKEFFDEVFDTKNPRERENMSVEFNPDEVE